MKIGHITESEFPIDERFRGNEVLISYYMKNSRHDNFVLPKKGKFDGLNEILIPTTADWEKLDEHDALVVHDFKRSFFNRILEENYQGNIFFFLHCMSELYPFSLSKA